MTAVDWALLKCELRGEKKLFILTATTLAFATAALTLVLSLTNAFSQSFSQSAKILLGGDVAVRLSARDFSAAEKKWLGENSRRLSEIYTARMLAVAGDASQLARLKAVDINYPLHGEIRFKKNESVRQLFGEKESSTGLQNPPAAIGEELSALLNIGVGDAFQLGELTLRVADIILSEPDPDPRLWVGAPLVLVHSAAIKNLIKRRDVLLERHIRAVVDDTPSEWRRALEAAFPDGGWRIQIPDDAMSNLRRLVTEIRNFLTLVSLAAILMAGIGAGGGVTAFLRGRIRAIAVVKMLGGDARLVRRVYLLLVLLFSLLGVVVGGVVGGAAYYASAPFISQFLPPSLSLTHNWSWNAALTAAVVAALMSAAFAASPVIRFAKMNPLLLFNAGGREDEPPPLTIKERAVVVAVAVLAVAAIPLPLAAKAVALIILFAALLLYAFSMFFARLLEPIAQKFSPPLSWGLLVISRNRRQTAAGVVSFGIGLTLFASVANVERNFYARIDDALKRDSPALYLTGVRDDQLIPLAKNLSDISKDATLKTTPFLRGRITDLGGRKNSDIKASPEFRWILRGDRGLTWTDNDGDIGASKVSAGKLWDDSVKQPQASFDAQAADAFGLKLGDALGLNILGKKLTVVVTSFREIDWQSFDINFVIILSERPFGDAPFSRLGAVFLPPKDSAAAQLSIGKKFPNITPISTADIFDAAKRLLTNTALLLKITILFLIVGGLPVIVATLVESQRRRLKDAVSLRLLGGERKTIALMSLVEFFGMAVIAVLPAAVVSMLIGKVIVEYVFDFDLLWRPHWDSFFLFALSGVALFLLLGIITVAHCLKQPPLPLLQNE